jgi:hypothetical protein
MRSHRQWLENQKNVMREISNEMIKDANQDILENQKCKPVQTIISPSYYEEISTI